MSPYRISLPRTDCETCEEADATWVITYEDYMASECYCDTHITFAAMNAMSTGIPHMVAIII